MRIAKTEDLAAVEAALGALEPAIEGTSITVDGGWTRPPLEPTPESRILFAKAREHGRELGLELEETSSGGGSDANLVAALGVPVLDGLGATARARTRGTSTSLSIRFPSAPRLLARRSKIRASS